MRVSKATIGLLIAGAGVLAAYIALFVDRTTVIELEPRLSDHECRLRIEREFDLFGTFIDSLSENAPSSIRRVGNEHSFKGIRKSSSYVNAVRRVVKSAEDACRDRGNELSWTIKAALSRTGLRDTTLATVGFLADLHQLQMRVMTRCDSVVAEIKEFAEAQIRSTGL